MHGRAIELRPSVKIPGRRNLINLAMQCTYERRLKPSEISNHLKLATMTAAAVMRHFHPGPSSAAEPKQVTASAELVLHASLSYISTFSKYNISGMAAVGCFICEMRFSKASRFCSSSTTVETKCLFADTLLHQWRRSVYVRSLACSATAVNI